MPPRPITRIVRKSPSEPIDPVSTLDGPSSDPTRIRGETAPTGPSPPSPGKAALQHVRPVGVLRGERIEVDRLAGADPVSDLRDQIRDRVLRLASALQCRRRPTPDRFTASTPVKDRPADRVTA